MLREHWNAHLLSASQIARELGVSRNAVIGRAHRMGLDARGQGKPPKPFPVVNQRIKPRPKPLPTFVPTPTTKRPVRLMKLRADGCRWVEGEPAGLLFCGQVQQEASSYCAAHHVRAHVRPR